MDLNLVREIVYMMENSKLSSMEINLRFKLNGKNMAKEKKL